MSIELFEHNKTAVEVPQNIKFYTYAKLMYMSDEDFSEIRPDIFVLDEFHRCGSEVWGARVEALLAVY